MHYYYSFLALATTLVLATQQVGRVTAFTNYPAFARSTTKLAAHPEKRKLSEDHAGVNLDQAYDAAEHFGKYPPDEVKKLHDCKYILDQREKRVMDDVYIIYTCE
jgi:protoheme ferro-lyase